MKKKINLYLDDLRDCPFGFTIARTVEEAKHYLENFEIAILSLDHDLGIDEKGNLRLTGYDLVKYMCEHSITADRIFLHTDNAVGRDNMYYTLLGAKKRGFIPSYTEVYSYPLVPNKYSER